MSTGEWIESHLSSFKWITSFFGEGENTLMYCTFFCVLKGLWEWIYFSYEFHSAKQTLYGRVSVDWWIKWFSMATNQCVLFLCSVACGQTGRMLINSGRYETHICSQTVHAHFFHICVNVNHLSMKNKLLIIVQCISGWIFCMFYFFFTFQLPFDAKDI